MIVPIVDEEWIINCFFSVWNEIETVLYAVTTLIIINHSWSQVLSIKNSACFNVKYFIKIKLMSSTKMSIHCKLSGSPEKNEIKESRLPVKFYQWKLKLSNYFFDNLQKEKGYN